MADWNGAVASREEVRELKRRAALRVAARMFNEKGYHATSLDEIAEEIGVTKTALYYYFKNKEQLLYDCLQVTYACGKTARLESQAMDGSALERLTWLYERFIILLMQERGAYTTVANIQVLPPERQQELLERRRKFDRYSRMLLSQAIEEGSIRKVDVRITSNYFLGAVNWILRWYSDSDDHSAEEVSAIFLDLLFNGVALRD